MQTVAFTCPARRASLILHRTTTKQTRVFYLVHLAVCVCKMKYNQVLQQTFILLQTILLYFAFWTASDFLTGQIYSQLLYHVNEKIFS